MYDPIEAKGKSSHRFRAELTDRGGPLLHRGVKRLFGRVVNGRHQRALLCIDDALQIIARASRRIDAVATYSNVEYQITRIVSEGKTESVSVQRLDGLASRKF